MLLFKSSVDFYLHFSSEENCRGYLEEIRWNGTPICAKCGCKKSYKIKNTKFYRCANKDCKTTYSVTTGTFFENTKVSLRKWFIAILAILDDKKGVSSYHLAKMLGISQKAAWHMSMRIKKALKDDDYIQKFEGIVESDETFVGGKNKNRHWDKKVPYSQGRSFKDKTPVLGFLQRGKGVKCFVVPDTKSHTIQLKVLQHIKEGTTLMTDEWKAYRGLGQVYDHHIVDHGRKQYVDGNCYTNGLENFWSILKRGIIGVYHKVSRRHLQFYCDEFTYRFNHRKLSQAEQFHRVITLMECRLRYRDLVAA